MKIQTPEQLRRIEAFMSNFTDTEWAMLMMAVDFWDSVMEGDFAQADAIARRILTEQPTNE